MGLFAYKLTNNEFNFRNSKFRYHPQPRADELLTSWLVRTAYKHRSDPTTFINLYLPDWRDNLWNRDVDISTADKLVSVLSLKTGFSVETVFGMTLRSYEGFLSEEICPNTRNIFIQPVVSRGRIKTKGGLRYCPLCLKEDEIPYFRKKWRLSFSTACLKHGCYLMDGCPECGVPLTIYRRRYDYDRPHCYECGSIYEDVRPEFVYGGPRGLEAIRRLYDTLDEGVFVYEGGSMYSFHIFMIVRQLIKIIYYWNRREGIREDIFERGMVDWEKEETKESLLESIPLRQQHYLFLVIIKILENYPESLNDFCEKNFLGKTELTRDMPYVPYVYGTLSDSFIKDRYVVTAEEIGNVRRYLNKIGEKPLKKNVCKILDTPLQVRSRKPKRRKELMWCLRNIVE